MKEEKKNRIFISNGKTFDNEENLNSILNEDDKFCVALSGSLVDFMVDKINERPASDQRKEEILANVHLTMFLSFLVNTYDDEELKMKLFFYFYTMDKNLNKYLKDSEEKKK